MPCYKPLKAFRSTEEKTVSGKQKIIFSENESAGESLELPCGRCIGCRLERSRQWAVRCLHEASLHERNCFITLTINEEQSEERRSTLIKRDFQLFMKRLRRRFPDEKIGYYYCGEYGEKFSRPHYHACIFNFDFPDKILWKDGENKLYQSDILNEIWGLGYTIIGDVTFESAAYVARYIMKKITGEESEEHYGGRLPEYTNMSKKPAIGMRWIEKWKTDVYPSDEVIVRARQMRPARYYDKWLEKNHPKEFENLKLTREEFSMKYLNNEEFSKDRQLTKYEAKILSMNQLKRKYETITLDENFNNEILEYDSKQLEYLKQGVKYEN